MAEKSQKRMIQETYQTVGTLKTVLLGVPNTEDKGLVGEVRDVKSNGIANTKSITKIKIVLAAVFGSGALGTGIWKVASLING